MADDRAHAKTEAKDFLFELLRDGPVDSKEAQKEARDAGIAPRTLVWVWARLHIGLATPEIMVAHWFAEITP
jgi:hypothetical protein